MATFDQEMERCIEVLKACGKGTTVSITHKPERGSDLAWSVYRESGDQLYWGDGATPSAALAAFVGEVLAGARRAEQEAEENARKARDAAAEAARAAARGR